MARWHLYPQFSDFAKLLLRARQFLALGRPWGTTRKSLSLRGVRPRGGQSANKTEGGQGSGRRGLSLHVQEGPGALGPGPLGQSWKEARRLFSCVASWGEKVPAQGRAPRKTQVRRDPGAGRGGTGDGERPEGLHLAGLGAKTCHGAGRGWRCRWRLRTDPGRRGGGPNGGWTGHAGWSDVSLRRPWGRRGVLASLPETLLLSVGSRQLPVTTTFPGGRRLRSSGAPRLRARNPCSLPLPGVQAPHGPQQLGVAGTRGRSTCTVTRGPDGQVSLVLL